MPLEQSRRADFGLRGLDFTWRLAARGAARVRDGWRQRAGGG
jgi:hypothetical protein